MQRRNSTELASELCTNTINGYAFRIDLTQVVHTTVLHYIRRMHLNEKSVLLLGVTKLTYSKIFGEDVEATMTLVVNVGQFLVTKFTEEVAVPIRIDR